MTDKPPTDLLMEALLSKMATRCVALATLFEKAASDLRKSPRSGKVDVADLERLVELVKARIPDGDFRLKSALLIGGLLIGAMNEGGSPETTDGPKAA